MPKPLKTGATVKPGSQGRDFEPFIDRREVERRLRVGSRQISEWMRRGFLPHYRMDRAVLFKWSEIERHLDEHFRVGPPVGTKP